MTLMYGIPIRWGFSLFAERTMIIHPTISAEARSAGHIILCITRSHLLTLNHYILSMTCILPLEEVGAWLRFASNKRLFTQAA